MNRDVRPERAKQGRWGGQVLFVLLGGLALALLVWVVVEIYGSAISPDVQPGQVETSPEAG